MANQKDVDAMLVTISDAMTGNTVILDTDQDVRNFRKFVMGVEQDIKDFNEETERFSAKLNREVLFMEIFTVAVLGTAALLIGIPVINYLHNR